MESPPSLTWCSPDSLQVSPLDFPLNPSYLPVMKKIQFDQNGIYASNPKLSAIALQVMEQEKRERELRRSLTDEDLNGGQWGIWNISDRD